MHIPLAGGIVNLERRGQMSELTQWLVAGGIGLSMLVIYFWRSYRRFAKEVEKDSHWLHD